MGYNNQPKDEIQALIEQNTKKMTQNQTQPRLQKGDNARFLRNALAAFSLPPIDISDEKQVGERIEWYFNHCIENDIKPGLVGLCNALGVTRMTFFNWQSKVTPERKEHHKLAVKAKSLIEELYEQYMMNGKINPVTGIFLMKNNFEGYYDRQDMVISPGENPLDPQKDENELKRLYSANDIEE